MRIKTWNLGLMTVMRGHEYRLLTNDEADDEGQGQAVAQDGHTGQECPQLCLRVPSLRQAELAPGDRGHRMTEYRLLIGLIGSI